MFFDAQLDKDWVIQQVNGKKVNNIAGLQKLFTQFKGQEVTITAARDYNFKKFEVQLK
jgi:S1-C subfamily serine protease